MTYLEIVSNLFYLLSLNPSPENQTNKVLCKCLISFFIFFYLENLTLYKYIFLSFRVPFFCLSFPCDCSEEQVGYN